ncbi:MAG: BlaI/MecI/CopY family transcriptional regulator [Planctomycetes bacterium]|nr:BlaI/MecI/CopY family transcriptional regulator [Planctomycetota bacterium]
MTPRPNRPNRPSPGRSGGAAITDAELTVLKVLWEHGPATVRELLDRLGTDWAYTTVQTLVGRLVEKGHVRANRRGHAHVFAAATARDELAERRVEEVANTLLDGAVAPLVLRLVERGRFSAEDIARFRALLAEAEAKAKTTAKKPRSES